MNHAAFKKKIIAAGILFAAVFVGWAASRPLLTQAGFFEDLLERIRIPFFFENTGDEEKSPAVITPREVSATSTERKDAFLYQPALDYERAIVEAVKRNSPAVVSITVSKNVPVIEQCPQSPFMNIPPEFREFFGDLPQSSVPCERGTRLEEVGGGSGFIISSDGLIVTNKHVVLDGEASYTVFLNDGTKHAARVLARDPVQDLAVLKIEARGLPTVELGDSDTVALGQTAIAIGNALGEFRNTVSVGVISGLARTITASGGGVAETFQGLIQTDAAINLGNSGGPLINLRGQVIGINTAVASGAQNVGFAIPINRAKRDIRSVQTSGEINAPFLGVRYVTVTPEIVESESLARDYGALVRKTAEGPAVMPDSPAAKAGVEAGDIILQVNGKKIDRDNTLVGVISQFDVYQTVELKVFRNGKELTVPVALGKRPQ